MKIDSKRKMEKVCQVMEYLSDLLVVVMLAATVLFSLFLFVLLVADPAAMTEADLDGRTVAQVELITAVLIVMVAVEAVCFCYLRRVFRRARFGSPFSEETAHSLRLAAAYMLLAGLITPVAAVLDSMWSAGGSTLFGSIDLNPFVFALFFYALSLMFDYGAALQRESDETL